jgi:hypothetical protein
LVKTWGPLRCPKKGQSEIQVCKNENLMNQNTIITCSLSILSKKESEKSKKNLGEKFEVYSCTLTG